jgi:tellurite methyltransferase
MNKPFWEDAYKNQKTITFGKPSQEIIQLSTKLPINSKILDMGCGDGRNALFLAQKGFSVDAFDISEAGIEKLNFIAKNQNTKINAWVQDIGAFEFNKKYDFIISHGVLHLLKREDWQKSIKDVKYNTNKKGVNVVAVFTDKISPTPDLVDFMQGLFKENEIRTLYNDWKIELFENYTFDDEHPGGIKHTHALNKIVAWKV